MYTRNLYGALNIWYFLKDVENTLYFFDDDQWQGSKFGGDLDRHYFALDAVIVLLMISCFFKTHYKSRLWCRGAWGNLYGIINVKHIRLCRALSFNGFMVLRTQKPECAAWRRRFRFLHFLWAYLKSVMNRPESIGFRALSKLAIGICFSGKLMPQGLVTMRCHFSRFS